MLYWTLSPISFDPAGNPPLEKLYSVILFTAGLSLRKLKERLEVLHQRELEEVEELEELVTTMAGGEEVILT
jgi:hypothetical protein